MNLRFATPEEINRWNDLIVNNPTGGSIFQGKEFAEQKQIAGWTPRYIIADTLAILFFEKNIFLLGKIWYAPKGPGIASAEALATLLPGLKEFAKKQGVCSLKIEPELLDTPENHALLNTTDLISTRGIQPNIHTVLLDISADSNALLASLPQKGRYAINRAKRDGVTVASVAATDANCRKMYDLLAETAVDAHFAIRPYDYYKAYYQRYEKAGIGQLFFAYFNHEIVAAAYVLALGKKGTYKDGASIRKRTAYGASHLLQWEAITWLKSKGVAHHDLCGAPPSSQAKDPSHPLYGVGLFKTSFSPEITDFIGAYNLPIRKIRGMLWHRWLEKIVRKIYFIIKKESFY